MKPSQVNKREDRLIEKAIRVKVPHRPPVDQMAAHRRVGRGEGRRWR